MHIDNDGIRLNVVADGPADGPPVLFLHGLRGSTATYDFLVPELPGRRLLRLDFRGHGHSDRAPGGDVADGFASDAEAVLEQAAGGPL
jgi:pimeloyl-ACP methyl ester carboxylesterase